MRITYVGHSGFFVELQKMWLLFDYYIGQLPALPAGKPGYVFVSHRHLDHFNPNIFRLMKDRGDVRYILSADIREKRIPEELRERTVRLKPEAEFCSGDLRVRTLRSTDEGVAFLAEAEGKVLYHAGDLNDWRWKEESADWNRGMRERFCEFIEPLRGMEIDAAFIPLDPRQGEYYASGMDYFLELAKPKKVYPMHFWGKPEIIDRWFREHEKSPYRDRIVKINGEGEVV